MILGDASSQCLTALWLSYSGVTRFNFWTINQIDTLSSDFGFVRMPREVKTRQMRTHTHKIQKKEMLLSPHGTKTPNNYAPCTSLYYAWIIEPLPQRHRTACQLKREHVSKASSALDTLSKQWSQLWLLVSYWELHYLCGNFVRILYNHIQ